MLFEYATLSGNMIDFEFIDPGVSEEKQQEAMQNGIQPLMFRFEKKTNPNNNGYFLGQFYKQATKRKFYQSWFLEQEWSIPFPQLSKN